MLPDLSRNMLPAQLPLTPPGRILIHRKSIPAIIPKKTYLLFAKQEQINAYFASLEPGKPENKLGVETQWGQ
jgi:hypothetical protein